jgi:glyceraldehyde-3-phosphate dehydrogenase/erythrose-4-phosphate dehydrogenase
MKQKIALVGYGVIGKRVADAVALIWSYLAFVR